MKANRNQKINRICHKLYSKYRKNVISLVTAAVLLVTSMPLADISGVVSKMVSTVTNAITAMAADTYTDISNDIKNGVFTIQNADDFKKLLNADPADYQKITILFSNNQSQFKASDFTGIEKGLGNEEYPFMGTVKANEGSAINLPINFALFEYLSDSANLDTIIFARPEEKNSALLAENVIHGDVASANKWKIKTDPVDDSGATNYKSFTSVIGNMKNGANVDLDITLRNDVKVEVSGGDNADLACGTMDENASLAVSLSSSLLDVSGKSNAGVFVGKMSADATLNIDKCNTLTDVNISANNAGGLVGSAENAEINVGEDVTLTMTGSVTGSVTAGGLFGSYTYSKADSKEFDISKFSGMKMALACSSGDTADSAAVGSVFGVLINRTDSVKISITGTTNDTITSNFNGTVTAGFYGGIVGRYSANALSSELEISDVTVDVTGSCNSIDFGGLIGKIGDNSKAYVSVRNTTISIKNSTSSQNNYGGLVGYADQAFIDVGGNVTVTANNVSANQSVGGIVGKFNKNGVVRLGGETNLSEFYPKDPNKNGCQIVGNRGNALIYSLSGWSFTRTSSKVIDDMDWGGVLRLNNSDLLKSADGVLSFDGSGHTVTINGFTNNSITISNRADFARAALIMQHDSNDFVKYSENSIDKTAILKANFTLSADVDISDTGLTGFMRDNGENTFTGILNGNSHKLTMTVGTENDKIVFHTHNGLFAKTSSAKISNIKLVSNFNIVGDNVSGGDACYIGSVSAYNSGALTIDSVTANVTASPSGAYTNFVGGLVGYVADAISEVSFTNSAVTANLTYDNSTTKVDCTCLGGVIGMVGAVTSKPTTGIKFDNVTVGGNITDKHTGPITGSANARVGGLIAEIGSTISSSPNIVKIQSVSVNTLNIKTSTKISGSTSGGFIGHNWYNVEVTLDKIIVSNSTITSDSNEIGGLVLSTTGYWSIKKVSFDSVTVTANNCKNFGMLASTLLGRNYDPYTFNYSDGSGSYYGTCALNATYFELTDPNGYEISSNTKINISKKYLYFDEIARCSIYASNTPVSNRQAIISIPAVNDKNERLLYMDGEHCNTYQNQTKNNGAKWKDNPCARYYYNLDVYKNGKASTGGAKATVWSARLFAASNIKNYICDKDPGFPKDETIDLRGYSYYPVDMDSKDTTISSNSTITFYNKEFNESENVSSSNSDNYARTTEGMDGTNLNNVHNQHYMMQSGLFRNENGAVTISGKLTFKGNIGKVNGGSGALVCGSVADDTNTTKKSVKITGSIVLDDLYVNDTSLSLNGENSYAPLLINKIGNMTEITIQNVSQKKHSMTAEKYYKGDQNYAATSLIGNVGSEKGQNISLTFSNIKLDASNKNSIFKNATLLESFQHSDGAGSSAIYNYKWDDDWGTEEKHNVTYGKEVSDTIKNSLDNVSRQNKYHGDWSRDDRYTSPDQNNATEEYSFTEYKPYVAISYDTTQNYDEIDVNLERPYLDEGCGTYSDPYILDASTLAEVARVISTAAPTNGWEVNYNAYVSADKSTVNANSAFCKGNNHKTYTYDGTGNFVSGNETVLKDNIIKYLCEAYYKINDDIVLGSSFAGLGGTSNSYVFRGVIVGQKKSDGTYPTITNNSASPLIRFSSGSVVKDINIKYTKEVTLSKNNNNKLNYSTGKTEYYGGVMGVVFGGDNIIDNVKVTNPNIIFANNDNSKQHLITAGGYVGAIVYGGVIFRNMGNVAKDSALTTSNTEAVDENADTNLFINPYIGRVVNGFAIEEGTKFGKSTNLNNGRKNYLITQFKSELSDEEKLNVIAGTTNTIEVPNAQALFMLSVISQSGMGYTDKYKNTCGYGHYTFTRNADYSKVGTATLASDDKDYKTAISDYQRLEKATSKEYEKKNSVMLKKYTKPSGKGLYEAKWAHDQSKKFTVKLTGNGTYDLTDTGFRGINQLFDAADSNLGGIDCGYTLSLTAIQGNDQTIKLDTDIKAYAVKITDNKGGSVNTVEFENVDNYKYRTAFDKVKGVGLINCSTYALTVDSLNLSGKISVKTYNNDGKSYVNEDLSTGGIVGGVQSSCKFSGITLNDLEVSGAYTVGGLIGKSTNNINISGVKSENSGIYVFGGFETGGLVGNSQKGSEFNVKDSKITINKVEFANLDKGTGTWFGVGGIVGSANIKTTISNVRLTPYNTDSFIGSKKDNKPLATQTMNEGGLIGLSNEVCTIENTSVSVDVYGSNAGGFVGINKKQLSVNENCYYGGTSDTSACGVYGYASSGGMVGKQNAAVNISKSVVKNAAIGIPTAKNGDAGIGGYVGIKANGDLKITDCEVNNVTLSAEDKSNGAGAGGVIGHNDRGSTYAYDILINKLGYVRGNNSVSVSNLIGWNYDKNLSSKFIGVSVNNTDCLPDIQYNASQIPASFTAVHSDYNGTQDNTKNIGEGSGTHVDTYSPYVNINPSFTVGGKTFTGDLVGGNMQTIISDAASYTNGTAKKSYGINSTIKTYAEDLANSKLITFGKASELNVEQLNDLPVLLIDDNSSLNITQMLAKYISVLTNYDVLDSSSNKLKTTDLMNVSTATYVYDNGSLTKSDKTTLTFNSKTGYFKVTDGQYDNDGTNRFTVITLDYTDPTGSGKTALRLHVPVFVRKVLDFSFQSYVISGTDYNHSHYTDKTKLAFESFDAPVTTYFKYSYYKSANEWEKMLNNGDSLLWSFDKKLYLIGDSATDSGVLTDDTKLTLVDANNNDKTYHSTASDAKFNKTTGELDLTNISGFKPVTMNDVLLRYASVTAAESSDGTLVEADDEATATVKTSDGKYYRPAGEAETGTYKITVSANSDTPKNDNDEMIISESYYLTITIPETGSSKKVIKNFVNYYSGNTSRKLNGNLPTHLVDSNTGTYVIANFFKQEVSVDAHDPEEITASNNFIHATMTSKISIDQSLRDTFNGYKSDDFNMYQAFKFSMKNFDENDAGANARIIAGTSVNVDYSILNSSDTELSNAKISKTETFSEAKDSYMLMYPDSVYNYINSDTNGSITVKADISLTYGTAGIIDQFPERKDGDTKTGIGVNASSYVAYSQNNIENSSISKSGDMPARRYYRKAMTVAQLNYNVAESTVLESKDSPFSQLGINAKDMTTGEMAITANAIYDLSALSRSTKDSGKKIQYTLKLYVKDNSGDYKQTNDISKYLSSFILENATSSSGLNDKECVFTTDYNGEEQNTAVTKFTVKTGKAFEEQGLTYANYRVELTAVLLNDNNSVVNGTTSSDYVVYTNAKIETGFINS